MLFRNVAFEREVFAVPNCGGFMNLNDFPVPRDGNPYLLEIRGKKASTALEAKHFLHYEQERVVDQCREEIPTFYCVSEDTHTIVLTRAERQILRRQERKEPMKQFRIGGEIRLPRSGEVTAGLHVHFSNDYQWSYYTRTDSSQGRSIEKRETQINDPINIPRIVHLMDKAFKDEIIEAGRQTGLYEMKPYGFEYRSLPTTVDQERLVSVLNEIQKENR